MRVQRKLYEECRKRFSKCTHVAVEFTQHEDTEKCDVVVWKKGDATNGVAILAMITIYKTDEMSYKQLVPVVMKALHNDRQTR